MAFQGSLEELPLPDIVQLVAVGAKTGAFEFRQEGKLGTIFLRKGQIVHAQLDLLEGAEAVYELAIWRKGEFVFRPGEESPTTSIRVSNTNLLMEAARRTDEWQVLAKKIPSTSMVPSLVAQARTTSINLTPAEWSLVRLIDGERSIQQVAASSGLVVFEVCKTLYGLLTSGLVTLAEPAPPAVALPAKSPAPALLPTPSPPPQTAASSPPKAPMAAMATMAATAPMAPAVPVVSSAPAAPVAPGDRTQQLRDLYDFFTRHISESLGLRGFRMQAQVEKATTYGDFYLLRDPFLEAAKKSKGEAFAGGLEAELDRLFRAVP